MPLEIISVPQPRACGIHMTHFIRLEVQQAVFIQHSIAHNFYLDVVEPFRPSLSDDPSTG